MSELAVRPVKPDDYESWLPLWTGYNTFYKRTLPPEITRTTWQRFFDHYEPVHGLVAEKDGRLPASRTTSFTATPP